MTTGGEGGMLCTPDKELWNKAWQFSQHGKNYDLAHSKNSSPGFRWLVQHEGTNLRMTEMQAAIGLCQLRKLDDWVARRARNSKIMQEALRDLGGLRVPLTPKGHAHYRCMVYAEGGRVARDRILASLEKAGLFSNVGPCPEIYREPFFADQGTAPEKPLPVARVLGDASLAFLVHHTIDEESMQEYSKKIAEVLIGQAKNR